MTGFLIWLGFAAGLFALLAHRLAFDALGVVLDTRPAAAALAALSILLTAFGLSGSGGSRTFSLRRLIGFASLTIAFITGILTAADFFRTSRSQEVRFSNGNITLAGTLYLPRGGTPPYPAVVITHGANASPRKEGEFYARLFAKNGIAALAYDKRGSGESGGEVEGVTYEELAGDAQAAVRHLAAMSEIDGEKIGFWGVSEGSWVVPIVAAEAKPAFVILVSVTPQSPAEQVRYEVGELVKRAGFDEATATRASDLYAYVSDFERTGTGYEELAAQLRAVSKEKWYGAAEYLPDTLPTFAELTRERWYPAWRQNMDFDARPFWEQVRCPVLLLLGGSDPKIDASKVTEIREALLKKEGADVTIQIYTKGEHGLVEWWLPGRLPPPRFPDGYPEMMADWVLARLGMPNKDK
ncbi:MAG: CocE/NonD family hydrolase [candidate division Zixibacteria bacterium]|nr:CocE/NonD family hydrolase [candidate division Zixibacteria bacterium]